MRCIYTTNISSSAGSAVFNVIQTKYSTVIQNFQRVVRFISTPLNLVIDSVVDHKGTGFLLSVHFKLVFTFYIITKYSSYLFIIYGHCDLVAWLCP